MRRRKNDQVNTADANNEISHGDQYRLKTEAVEQLTGVLAKQKYEKENPSAKSREQITPPRNPYKLDRLARIPTWIKAFFIKFWIGGVICYFFFWGLGLYINNLLDLMVLTGLVIGAVTDLVINTAFLYFESDQKEYHPFMFLPVSCKKLWTFLVNLPLGLLEMYLIFLLYSGINLFFVKTQGLMPGTITVGVEPFLFGLLYLIVDMAIISIKNIFVRIVKDAMKKAREQK